VGPLVSNVEVGENAFEAMLNTCTRITLVSVPDGESTVDMDDIAPGDIPGTLSFSLASDGSVELIDCPACWTGPLPLSCNLEKELQQ